MTWAQRLKRVFNIDIETCRQCGGDVKVIACIQDPAVIDKTLTHLTEPPAAPAPLPHSRAPPQAALFEWPDGKMPLPTQRGRAVLGPSAEHRGFGPE